MFVGPASFHAVTALLTGYDQGDEKHAIEVLSQLLDEFVAQREASSTGDPSN